MAANLDKYLDLFREKKAFAHIATVMPDGSPQVTPVWIDYRNGRIAFNTARGRVKDKNLKEGARIALSVQDPDNPYRYVQVRGTGSEGYRGRRQREHRCAREEVHGRGQIPLSLARPEALIYEIEAKSVQGM